MITLIFISSSSLLFAKVLVKKIILPAACAIIVDIYPQAGALYVVCFWITVDFEQTRLPHDSKSQCRAFAAKRMPGRRKTDDAVG